MPELETVPAAKSGFSEAISKILSHPNVPRPKRVKREEPTGPSASYSGSSLRPEELKEELPDSATKTAKSLASSKVRVQKNRSLDEPWHILPDVTDRERERKLTKIATRGVVQLFNAVRQQQSSIEEKLEEAGPSFRKSEKVLKSVSKGAFLDLLKNPTGSVKILQNASQADAADGEKRWEVLDDQYMLKSGSEKMFDEEEDSSEKHSNDDLEEVL